MLTPEMVTVDMTKLVTSVEAIKGVNQSSTPTHHGFLFMRVTSLA